MTGFNTKCVKAFYKTNHMGASLPDLNLSILYSLNNKNQIIYRRYNSSNNLDLIKAINSLYNRPSNGPITLTNCGLSAYTAICKFYKNQRKVVAYDLDDECQQAIRDTFGETIFIDMSKVDDFIFKDGDLVFIEPLSNPMLVSYDVKHICEVAHKANTIVIADNSILSVANYNPFDDGVDIVLESGTKWLSGSGDAMLGMLIGIEIPNEIWQYYGLNPNPIDCYLAQKGIPTLPIRMEYIRKNAKPITEYLETLTKYIVHDDRIGLITFCLGDVNFQDEFCKNLKIIFWGAAFGQSNSTIQSSNYKKISFLPEPFNWCLRMSVGLENSEDIISDIKQAYKKTLESKVGKRIKQE